MSAIRRHSAVVVAFLLGFGAAVILLALVKGVQFDTQVSVVDIIEVIITVVVLFVLQNIISERSSGERIEKDLVIAELRSIEKAIVEIGDICESSADGGTHTDGKVVLQRFRGLSNQLSSVRDLLRETPIKLDLRRFENVIASVFRFKKRVTGGRFPSARMTRAELLAVRGAVPETIRDVYRFMFYLNRV